MRREIINKILRETEEGYDRMADKFSHTRKKFWGELAFIRDYLSEGDRMLDYGCGNGRLWEILPDYKINYTGVDVSEKLIGLAKEKYPQHSESFFKISSLGSLAFPDNFFNCVISVAVFHHFPKEYARDVAQELKKILKPKGVAIITVWDLWQKKRRRNLFNFFALGQKIFQTGEYRGLGFFDVLIPFQNNQGEVFKRYHRVYTKRSLAKLFLSVGFEVEKCFLAGGKNIVLIARKK